MSSKQSQGPVLFIQKSMAKTPANNMQEVYTNRHEIEEKKAKPKDTANMAAAKKEAAEVPIPIEVSPQEKKQESSFSRVKSFKEMDLHERLEYLVNFPKVLPPVPCVFYTTNQRYQGYLTDSKGDEITIQFHDQSTKNVPINELKDIIMIGIKR